MLSALHSISFKVKYLLSEPLLCSSIIALINTMNFEIVASTMSIAQKIPQMENCHLKKDKDEQHLSNENHKVIKQI